MRKTILYYLAGCTLSALTFDSSDDLYKLHCSVYAHEENKDWLKRIAKSHEAESNAISHDKDVARRLWDISEQMVATPAAATA